MRSGVSARAAAATHQSSRSARERVRVGTRANPKITASNLITLSTTGHRRDGTLSDAVPVRKLASSQHSSFGCVTRLRTAIKAPNP